MSAAQASAMLYARRLECVDACMRPVARCGEVRHSTGPSVTLGPAEHMLAILQASSKAQHSSGRALPYISFSITCGQLLGLFDTANLHAHCEIELAAA